MDDLGRNQSGTADVRSGKADPATFQTWMGGRVAPLLSTNHGADEVAFQDWRRFKEAFAPEVVKKAIEETSRALGRSVRSCLDPFGGSGTTAMVCQFMGVTPTTIEVNPFLADLIEAKLTSYDHHVLEAAFAELPRRAAEIEPTVSIPFAGAPTTFVETDDTSRFVFWRDVAVRIAAYRQAIDSIENTAARRFYRVMLGAISVSVSNVVISGKGRRYRRNWRERHLTASAVDAALLDLCLRAILEIRAFAERPALGYELLRGDSRILLDGVGKQDLSVFSPPYPNSFDYTDVYNVELWTMGYLTGREDNHQLRKATLRSHVQIHRSFDSSEPVSPRLRETLAQLEEIRPRLWNKRIPEMVGAYFEDMRLILAGLHRKMETAGRVYMVVGDSRYAGVDVPVAKVLEEEAGDLGFEVINSQPCRSMRVSPQQGGRAELAETLLTLQAR